MDTEIFEENVTTEGEKEIKCNELKEGIVGDADGGVDEDSDAKMTLAVTSDEDSRESIKNANSQNFSTSEQDMLKESENISKEPLPRARYIGIPKRKYRSKSFGRTLETQPVKRKISDVYYSSASDSEDLLGFDEFGEAQSIRRHKKVKESSDKGFKTEHPNQENDNENKVADVLAIIKDEDKNDKMIVESISEAPKGSPKQQVQQIDVDKAQIQISGIKAKKEMCRKAFEMGWKREFVLRAIPGAGKEKGEVYYISPFGKKLRTRHEVQQYLTPGLTLDNFSFSKEPLGFEGEVIRSAKPTTRSAPSTPVEHNREPLGKRIPKPKAPKGASPPPQGWTATKAVKSVSTVQSPRPVAASRPAEESDTKNANKMKGSGIKSSKKGEPCTIQCTLAMGMIPQLQCIKCLCLFHHECVGLDRIESQERAKNPDETGTAEFTTSSNLSGQGKYICELCEKEPSTTQITTPLINPVVQSPKKTQPNAIISSQEPVIQGSLQLQQRSKMIDAMSKDIKQVAAVTTLKTLHSGIPATTSQTNPNPQNNNNESNIEQSVNLPQSIAVIKGRKYVVIRKPSAPYYKRSKEETHNQDHGNENSTTDSISTPLQTGDDLPIRKRIPNSRNKFSRDSPVPHQSHKIMQPQRPLLLSSTESFAANFFSNVSLGYDILFQIFQYLKVQELLRAACVCRVWYVVANHQSLWKTVRMKNSQVNDWTGLAAALRRNETKHLDLRKMLISSTNADEMWASFSKNIESVVSLETIDLCRCSSKIVESLFLTNPNLKVLNAVTIKDDTLNLENLNRLEKLEELRLKSIDGCTLESDLLALERLKKLRHLSLTSFRQLGTKEIEIIGELRNLESLELGECNELTSRFSRNVLPKLVNLERLRLEKGQGECCTLEILEAISKLEKLVQLELVNFDIKNGFDEKLAQCKNIKRLLLIPTYISQSATTNNIVLSAVLQLQDTLQTLTWAVTLELLRVTSLYVDQCDSKKKDKKFFDESIPVLKPVPGIPDDNEKSQKTTSDVPQVEILPLVKVEKILTMGMPTTKFKILKVPYHATWRQNLVDMQ